MRASLESRLRERTAEDGVVVPDYDEYCVANVPETALSLLADGFERRLPEDVLGDVATDVDNVVVFLLDGFGYEHWKRHRGAHPFLRRLEDAGTVAPLTTIYPSETAAALTTVSTGSVPVEHGLLGWFQYLESAGRIVETLPFRTLEGDPLADVSPSSSATELCTGRSIYERAERAGIDTYAIQPAEFVESGYTRATTAGATRVGYDTATDLALSIRRALEVSADPAYVYAYEPTIDAISHAEGTGTERYRQNLAAVLERLQHELIKRLDPELAERTLLVVTADHGIVDTAPDENVVMTDWEAWPSLRETFRRGADGDPRLPTGSPRNVHFHVRPDRLEDARGIVEANLDGRTFTREEALECGLFGPGEPSALFERRCGELIAVHRNRGLWWAEMDSIGMHGGLTDQEMLVPLAAARLDALRAGR
ncbi:alkaline phosphatase family protein [Natronococcus occultus]|uniref:Putative AP superfamily protein n=1 Tax=Natronococcus occultus SP4 TaxID=694430 RepID=L0JWS5_9EURY|nr:alkaline phosphatase family protein [Natronococcus occultus]AGB36760.1 putative AP superfamily protein [Natronococcus occultus SP4]